MTTHSTPRPIAIRRLYGASKAGQRKRARRMRQPRPFSFFFLQIVKTQWWPMASGSSSIKPIHQGRPVAVEEPHEADFTFLRVALGEGQGLRALELAAQRVVTPLRRLNHLVMQRLHFVLHLAERGFHRAFERRIDLRHRRGDRRHPLVDERRHRRQRLLDGRRQLAFEQLVERRFILRAERGDRQVVFRQESQRRRIGERRACRADRTAASESPKCA